MGANLGDGLRERDQKPPPPQEPAPPPPEPPQERDPLQGAKAILADSREAANLRARAGVQDGPMKALDKVAKNGEGQLKAARDLTEEMKGLRRDLTETQVIRAG